MTGAEIVRYGPRFLSLFLGGEMRQRSCGKVIEIGVGGLCMCRKLCRVCIWVRGK
jgi:hypothetical protein